MASSRNRRNADPVAAARLALGALRLQGARVAVGLSGGVDSVVLLAVMRELSPALGIRLSAIHVNHGLSRNAARWERFCAALCRRWKIPLTLKRVRVTRAGEGLEAAARAARRAAYASHAAELIALGHQLDDQAETVLHNLLRGAGARGASGMPVAGRLGGKRVIRPLLDVPREAIVAHARREGLEWVEDESNEDAGLTRNFLRRSVAPLVASRFPRWREGLARAARHMARRELDRADLLREFLAGQGLRAPSEARLAELLRQFSSERPGARARIEHDGATLRRWRGGVRVERRQGVVQRQAAQAFTPVRWRGASRVALPALGGELRFARGAGGIDPAKLAGRETTIRLRSGGERLKPEAARPRRTLKNLFQESAVPPWERERLPMLYCGADLVWVPGLGVDAGYQAAPGKRGLVPAWKPATSSASAPPRARRATRGSPRRA